MEWYLVVLEKYFDFSSRARRMEYWVFTLINFFIAGGFGVLDNAFNLRIMGEGVLGNLYFLATLIPAVALGFRRFHDIGHSGWWSLLWVPAVAVLLYAKHTGSLPGAAVGLVAFVLVLLFLLGCALVPGTRGPNRYGPDPLQETN